MNLPDNSLRTELCNLPALGGKRPATVMFEADLCDLRDAFTIVSRNGVFLQPRAFDMLMAPGGAALDKRMWSKGKGARGAQLRDILAVRPETRMHMPVHVHKFACSGMDEHNKYKSRRLRPRPLLKFKNTRISPGFVKAWAQSVLGTNSNTNDRLCCSATLAFWAYFI